jgi:hypothetical protein
MTEVFFLVPHDIGTACSAGRPAHSYENAKVIPSQLECGFLFGQVIEKKAC